MRRRMFLAGAALSPIAALAGAPSLPKNGTRISVEKDDPGYRNYCIANGDCMIGVVYLNGEKMKHCVTADESIGMVKVPVMTSKGNIAHADGEILYEQKFGSVRVELVPKRDKF